MTLQTFKDRFIFDSSKTGYLGVERECFIVDQTGLIVPKADALIQHIRTYGWPTNLDDKKRVDPGYTVGYELSNAQIELRTRPHPSAASLREELRLNDKNLTRSMSQMRLAPLHTEVGPEDMTLDVYPDPTGRYQSITRDMPRAVLLAACRVTGTHVHVGMKDHEMALHVYNYVTRHLTELCEVGNGSFGERLAIYRQMAPDYKPMPYESWDAYYQTALAKGFSEDPRQCWTLIRISVHGTIEFRMFGATDSIYRIITWAGRCLELCQEAMALA